MSRSLYGTILKFACSIGRLVTTPSRVTQKKLSPPIDASAPPPTSQRSLSNAPVLVPTKVPTKCIIVIFVLSDMIFAFVGAYIMRSGRGARPSSSSSSNQHGCCPPPPPPIVYPYSGGLCEKMVMPTMKYENSSIMCFETYKNKRRQILAELVS
jgi:hypothetical protein